MSEPPSTPTRSELEPALCRAALYRTLSLGLGAAPKQLERFLSCFDPAAVCAAAARLDRDRADAVSPAAWHLATVYEGLEPRLLADQLGRLFGHTARGATPPYETEYQLDAPYSQPQQLADIGGFYAAFGLRLGSGVHERPDHLSCECEFLMFLCRKEAFALEHGDQTMLQVTRSAQRLFLRDHLGRFAPVFASRALRQDPEGPCGALADLLLALVRSECAAFQIQCGPSLLELRSADEESVPVACGGCGPSGPAEPTGP